MTTSTIYFWFFFPQRRHQIVFACLNNGSFVFYVNFVPLRNVSCESNKHLNRKFLCVKLSIEPSEKLLNIKLSP
jgi:hypothetical protein